MAVLHWLGFATTPAVATQAGFTNAWTWALLRYFWAFTSVNGDLALSHEAASLRYHHRTALSEYLGIGFALEAAAHIAEQQFPQATVICVDAEEALVQAVAAGHVAPVGNALRPDYLVLAFDQANVVGLWSLECKGSKSTNGEVARLAKATRQVESLRIHAGGPPDGLVCSTVATEESITVSILDPDGDARWLGAFGNEESENVEHLKSADLVREPAAIRSDALALDSARLLTWSGAYASAKSIAPQWLSETATYEDRDPTTIRIGSTTYAGLESSFPTEEGDVTVFRGIDAGLRETLIGLGATYNRSALIGTRVDRSGIRQVEVDLSEGEAVSIDGSGAITRFVIRR